MSSTIVIRSIAAPAKISLDFNGNRYLIEYPSKQAAIDALTNNLQTEAVLEVALFLLLREWRKTDPTLTNLAGLVNKTVTINIPVVSIV